LLIPYSVLVYGSASDKMQLTLFIASLSSNHAVSRGGMFRRR